MSHRPEDHYGFVAVESIRTGMVTAFNAGDPVPDDTVKENPSWQKDGLVVSRDQWEDRPEDEPERPIERGQMPVHLRDKVAEDAPTESATSRTVRAGGASTKRPDASKSTGGKSST